MRDVISKSLRFAKVDLIFGSIAFGCTVSYIIPYVVFLEAPNRYIGLVTAATQLCLAIPMIFSAELTEKVKSRTRFVSMTVFLESLGWLFVSFSILIYRDLTLFLLLISFVYFMRGMGAPTFNSLLGDTVSEEERNKYFAWRLQMFYLIMTVVGFLAGFILHFSKKQLGDPSFGFFFIFLATALTRLICAVAISKMYDIPYTPVVEDKFSYLDFVKRLPKSNFAKFTFYVAALWAVIGLAGPFFSPYLLKELRWEYSSFTIVTMLSFILPLPFYPYFAKLSDKFGNGRMCKYYSLFYPIYPILWLFSDNMLYLFFITAFIMYINYGFALSTSNFILDVARPQTRIRCSGYYNLTTGIGLFLGSLIGGYIVDHLFTIKGSKILGLFLVSGIARGLVVGFLVNSFKEVKEKERERGVGVVMAIVGIKPAAMLIHKAYIVGRRLEHTIIESFIQKKGSR